MGSQYRSAHLERYLGVVDFGEAKVHKVHVLRVPTLPHAEVLYRPAHSHTSVQHVVSYAHRISDPATNMWACPCKPNWNERERPCSGLEGASSIGESESRAGSATNVRTRLDVPVHETAAVQALHRSQHAFRELEKVVQANAALLHQGDEVRPEELRGARDSVCGRSALRLLIVMQSLHTCMVPSGSNNVAVNAQPGSARAHCRALAAVSSVAIRNTAPDPSHNVRGRAASEA